MELTCTTSVFSDSWPASARGVLVDCGKPWFRKRVAFEVARLIGMSNAIWDLREILLVRDSRTSNEKTAQRQCQGLTIWRLAVFVVHLHHGQWLRRKSSVLLGMRVPSEGMVTDFRLIERHDPKKKG